MPEILKPVAEKLMSSGSVLIVLPPSPAPDAIAAALALSGYLKRVEKDSVVVSSDGQLNPRVDFLPGYDKILRELNLSKGFVIDVSTRRAPVAELSYKKENDRLSIYLKPKSGEFTKDDVTFRTSKFPYDAVVTLGVSSLESMGDFYGKFAELFFETPVINLDYRGLNEGFGQLNLVQLNATSVSEIVFDLINEMEKDLIDGEIATSLLAGIIAETNSFQHSRTTPQAFLKASQLVSLGGKQQDIVNRLYKSKSLGFLKLWGRVLARLEHEPESFAVRSAVNRTDVEKTGATSDDIAAVIKEMTQQLSFAKIHVFFRELGQQSTEVYLSAPATLHLRPSFVEYQPEAPQPSALFFTVPMPLAEAERKVMETVRTAAAKLT